MIEQHKQSKLTSMSTEDFISKLELSAKKILKDHTRRAKALARMGPHEQTTSYEDTASSSGAPGPPLYTISDALARSLKLTHSLSPLRTRPSSGSRVLSKTSLTKKQLSQSYNSLPVVKTSLVLEKLKESPYNSLSKAIDSVLPTGAASSAIDASAKAKTDALYSGQTAGAMRMFANGVLKNTKSDIMEIQHQQSIRAAKLKHNAKFIEAQGPIDWSSNSLRVKYRGEAERESAWSESLANARKSMQVFGNQRLVVPVVVVERHPVFLLYHKRLEEENRDVRHSIANRQQMKRFVCDVQEVWLSNLGHLAEHSIGAIGAMGSKAQQLPSPTQHTSSRSLRNRRDKTAILAMDSQIQSVSYKRAMQRAYVTTAMAAPTIVLDYAPPPPPPPAPRHRPAPVFETLCLPFQYREPGDLLLSQRHVFSVERLTRPDVSAASDTAVLWRLGVLSRDNCLEKYLFCAEKELRRHLSVDTPDALALDEACSLARAVVQQCASAIHPSFEQSESALQVWTASAEVPSPSLSLVASGAADKVSAVPGACDYGRTGLWLDLPESGLSAQELVERQRPTSVALHFKRDPLMSSTDTVFVYATLAIDLYNFVSATVIAWEPGSSCPPVAPSEDVAHLGYLPRTRGSPTSLLATPVQSPIHNRVSETVLIHSLYKRTRMSSEDDDRARESFASLSLYEEYLHSSHTCACSTREQMTARSFRTRCFVRLLDIDTNISTIIFGVSKNAALPNVTTVNARSVWHNTLPVLSDICRVRTAKDYFYVISGEKPSYSAGANVRTTFVIMMEHDEFKTVTWHWISEFEKNYTAIRERRLTRRRRDALDAKIERSEMLTRIDKKIRSNAAELMQMSIEELLRMSGASESKGEAKAKRIVAEVGEKEEDDADFQEPDDFWLPPQPPEHAAVLHATAGTAPVQVKNARAMADPSLDAWKKPTATPAVDASSLDLAADMDARIDPSPLRVRDGPDPDDAEFDSDDDLFFEDDDGWSVTSSNVKAVEAAMGATPASKEEVAAMLKEQKKSALSSSAYAKSTDRHPVPPLPFGIYASSDEGPAASTETASDLAAWRRLPKHDIKATQFLGLFKKRRTMGPEAGSFNATNKPVYLLPVASRDVTSEMARAVSTLDRHLRVEEELALLAPADEEQGAQAMTSVEMYLARQQLEAKRAFEAESVQMQLMSAADLRVGAIERAIMAAKTSNIAMMEEALDSDVEGGISPDLTTDERGNTLLILAAQQGSKRMLKLLLRRGANINRQNIITGNTCLHYCCLFSHEELVKYLISKGANDSILNADGFTCYEAHVMGK